MPIKGLRYLSQSTDSLNRTNQVTESMESLTDEGHYTHKCPHTHTHTFTQKESVFLQFFKKLVQCENNETGLTNSYLPE